MLFHDARVQLSELLLQESTEKMCHGSNTAEGRVGSEHELHSTLLILVHKLDCLANFQYPKYYFCMEVT